MEKKWYCVTTEGSEEARKIASSATTLDGLIADIRQALKLQDDISLTYYDSDFQQNIAIDDLQQIPEKSVLKVVKKQVNGTQSNDIVLF